MGWWMGCVRPPYPYPFHASSSDSSNAPKRLLIASEYEPYSMTAKLHQYMAGSANIVVHSPYLQVGSDTSVGVRFEGLIVGGGRLCRW